MADLSKIVEDADEAENVCLFQVCTIFSSCHSAQAALTYLEVMLFEAVVSCLCFNEQDKPDNLDLAKAIIVLVEYAAGSAEQFFDQLERVKAYPHAMQKAAAAYIQLSGDAMFSEERWSLCMKTEDPFAAAKLMPHFLRSGVPLPSFKFVASFREFETAKCILKIISLLMRKGIGVTVNSMDIVEARLLSNSQKWKLLRLLENFEESLSRVTVEVLLENLQACLNLSHYSVEFISLFVADHEMLLNLMNIDFSDEKSRKDFVAVVPRLRTAGLQLDVEFLHLLARYSFC